MGYEAEGSLVVGQTLRYHVILEPLRLPESSFHIPRNSSAQPWMQPSVCDAKGFYMTCEASYLLGPVFVCNPECQITLFVHFIVSLTSPCTNPCSG